MVMNQKGVDKQVETQYVGAITWPEVHFGWN